ncbi:hypothetical protein PPROV_001017300 [Pycnococcus provasolii]|uniref:BPL/LPL catalytic domain-containing protein n=1 Tax=Pycnococcus provasolii TaxID=41880 RepID=A0A830HXX3_9CHLO|nr:hypothetical protein PPROV_001017300 [Pycnococcus provasolii]
MTLLSVLCLRHVPALTYLHIEEYLLRATSKNWLIINDGVASHDSSIGGGGGASSSSHLPFHQNDLPRPSPTPRYGDSAGIGSTAILGLGGKLHEWVDTHEAASLNVPVIRRFTGGGAVLVDTDTIFVSTIMNDSDAAVAHVEPYPGPIMQFISELYTPAWKGLLTLRENDFILTNTNKKFGGNAQAITKGRWLQHTSVLWDTNVDVMTRVLRSPTRRPKYRGTREHSDFVVTLKDVWDGDRASFVDAVLEAPMRYDVRWSCAPEDAREVLKAYEYARAHTNVRIGSKEVPL